MSNILFLIGGPGSGKDLVIKELNALYILKEYNIEQIKQFTSLAEDCIISANAYKKDQILSIKESLEESHNISAIYVDVNDDVSKQRLTNRNLNESVRIDRLLDSKLNLDVFEEQFTNLFYFDNSFDKDSDETGSQLKSLVESLDATSLKSKRQKGIAAASNNRQIYKNKVETTAKENSKLNPHQLDKQVKDYLELHFRKKLTHDLKKVEEDSEYNNFKTDKEVKKEKKIPKDKFLKGIIPRKSLGPTFDTRETGDTALIQTFATNKAFEEYDNLDQFLDEAVDSPNDADTGLFGGVNSPNVNQSNDKPLFGYQVSKEKNKNRKKNFETDKETKKESTYVKIKKIFFKG